MFSKFTYESIALDSILLDEKNPRIVTQTKLKTQEEILEYLFEHEDLAGFIKKIATEGRNRGAERPYVVKQGKKYVVVEGNTRIAAYKVLTGQMKAPRAYAGGLPHVAKSVVTSLETVECSISPNRDMLLPIMASAHFGTGDKSKWGYLGSRKAVYDEYISGRSVAQLAKAFHQTQGEITALLLEYELYKGALALDWTVGERNILLKPDVQFNPPVRFLQAKGHKEQVGISYDKANLKIDFENAEAKKKFKHLVYKLVVNPQSGLGATATYGDVFFDYKGTGKKQDDTGSGAGAGGSAKGKGKGKSSKPAGGRAKKPKSTALFTYAAQVNDATLRQLMSEAQDINCVRLPGASTCLLRSIVETVLKHIIDAQKANPQNKSHSLESALSLCQNVNVNLTKDDKKILKEFQSHHLDYLNLGNHGNQVPNKDRLFAARDCIDGFIKRHV